MSGQRREARAWWGKRRRERRRGGFDGGGGGVEFDEVEPQVGGGAKEPFDLLQEILEVSAGAGEVFLEKNFGNKAGLTTFDCTQTGELGDIFTLTVAVVPKP